MKRLVPALAAIALLAACSNKEKHALEVYAQQQNNACPVVADSQTINTAWAYDKKANELRIDYTYGESENSVAELRSYRESMKDVIARNMRSADMEPLVAMMVEAEASLRVCYTGGITADTLSVVIPASEVKAISAVTAAEESDMQRLDAIIATENASLPQELGKGFEMSAVTLDSSYVVYTYRYDPAHYNIGHGDSLRLDTIVTSFSDEFFATAEGRERRGLMERLGVGLRFSFAPFDSTETMSIVYIEPAEAEANSAQ